MCGTEEKEAPVCEIKKDSERTCTDIPCLLLFFAFWVVTVAIWINAAVMGADPNKIVRGTDYQGRVCGVSSGVSNMSLAAWPSLSYSDIEVCTDNCSITLTFNPAYNSEKFLYYCLPTTNLNGDSVSLSGGFDSAADSATRAIGDIWTAWPILLASVFVAMALSFFYIWIAEKVGACLVVCMIVLTALAGTLGGYALIKEGNDAANDATSDSTDRATAMRAVGYLVIALTVIFLIVIFAIRKRIMIALEVMGEASKALLDMPGLIFFPILPLLIGLAYLIFWICESLYIFSVLNEEDKPMPQELVAPLNAQTYKSYSWNDNEKNAFVVHFFGLLWNVQFWIYFTYFVVAGTAADWYFTPRDSNGEKRRGAGDQELDGHPVAVSCKRTCRFHLGTICFGSAVLACIQFIRAVFHYIDEKTKADNPNFAHKCVACLISCCLKCIECCMDKISKNAFVWTAIYGDSFVTACCSSFSLIWSNLVRLAAISLVGDYVLLLGTVLVAALTTGMMAMAVDAAYSDKISSLVLPVIIIFLGSYLIASLFMVVFETTIDTIFLCFLVDEKFNKGTGQMLAPPSLIALVDKHQENSTQTAKLMKQKSLNTSDGYTPI